jgi:hypothetical protein
MEFHSNCLKAIFVTDATVTRFIYPHLWSYATCKVKAYVGWPELRRIRIATFTEMMCVVYPSPFRIHRCCTWGSIDRFIFVAKQYQRKSWIANWSYMHCLSSTNGKRELATIGAIQGHAYISRTNHDAP